MLDKAESLGSSSESLDTILERVGLPAFFHDRERIVRSNHALEMWLGYEAGELTFQDLAALAQPADRAALLAAIGATDTEPPELPHIQRFCSAAGEVRIGQALARHFVRANITGRLVLIQPWSASLRSGDLLRVLEAAVDQLHDIVFITEAESIDGIGRRIVFVNSAYSHVAGFGQHEVIGRTPNITVGTETQRDVLKRIEASLSAGKPVHEQLLKYGKDGHTYWVDLTIVPVFDEKGMLTHWLSVQRDITENKRLLEQLVQTERLASAGMLAAGLTHEINNPLTSVTSSIEWLSEQVPELIAKSSKAADASAQAAMIDAITGALSDALSGAKRVETTLKYLSELAGNADEVVQPVDVCDLLDIALERVAAQLAIPGAVIREYRRTPLALGSDTRLTHVFFNLIMNAAQALDHRAAEKNRIVIRTSVDISGKVRIDVEDTGVGISPKIARRLFAPFVSTRPRGVGKGLGLFMAREIVRSYSGELTYRSEPGRGSAFSIVLPTGGARSVPAYGDDVMARALGRTRVLVVDRDPLVLRELRRLVSASDVVAVQSKRVALELIAKDADFDLIFAELEGTAFDGLALKKRIAELDASLEPRVILMNDPDRTTDRAASASNSQIAVVQKPLSREQIQAAVAAVLGMPSER